MAKKTRKNQEMREEYDFSGGERGKYATRFQEQTNVVLLDPDVASQFASAEEINDALRDALRKRRASGDA
jgi:hypothetical protein